MSRKIHISKPDKKIFPAINATKKDIAEYYDFISPLMLPHVKHRPLTLERYPDGVERDGFIQQNVPDYFPKWIRTISVQRENKGQAKMLECHTKSALKYVIDQAGICFHSWLSLENHLNQPDLMVFDLDPSGNHFSQVMEAALEIKKLAEEIDASVFVMTTGSSGLHIHFPIKPQEKFDSVRNFAKTLGSILCSLRPDLFTLEIRKEKRKGKILVDYFRNSYGQTTISPYSLRSHKKAPIAVPLHWNELHKKGLDSQLYTIKNIRKRIENTEDPWKDIYKKRKTLKKMQEKLHKKYGDRI